MRWLKLLDAYQETKNPMVRAELARVYREAEERADAEQPVARLSTAGIYISDRFDRYRTWYTAYERDRRGRVVRKQATKTFRRDEAHDVDGELVDALTAAIEFKQQRDADAALERERRTQTLDETFEHYVAARELRPKTVGAYRGAWRKYVTPTIGGYDIGNVTVAVVDSWYAGLDAPPAAKAKAGSVVRSVLRDAYRGDKIPQDPGRVLRISGSRVRSLRPDEIPTTAQVARLADEVGDRYRALVLLMALGGLRIGEAVALKVDRIDWARRLVVVDANAPEFGSPKTQAGERPFTAPRILIDALRHHVETYPTTTGLVFSVPSGAPVSPRNFRKRVFGPAAERAGLPGLTPHDLRHTAASTLAAQGATATEIAQRLGHSNPAVTQRVYLHLLKARDEELAEGQDAAWQSARGKGQS